MGYHKSVSDCSAHKKDSRFINIALIPGAPILRTSAALSLVRLRGCFAFRTLRRDDCVPERDVQRPRDSQRNPSRTVRRVT